jgi:hypothetical protein
MKLCFSSPKVYICNFVWIFFFTKTNKIEHLSTSHQRKIHGFQ